MSRQPSHAEQDRVRSAFDPDMLSHICTTWDFSPYATKYDLPGDNRFYWYQDNGSDILAVAHLDTVQGDRSCQVIETAAGPLAVSGALDDRLGAYVILELLPLLGVTCDWLLTTDEEMGATTAREFAEDFEGKDYNWIIEFDRGGTDVVMYQYETHEYCKLVEASGARVGIGSYSDISELDYLGCAAFNWGVGYQDYHSPRSHAWLNDTFKMVARFLRFYDANATTWLPHEDAEPDTSWLNYADASVDADCGHEIDLADDSSYVEWNKEYIICFRCAEQEFLVSTGSAS
jgi:Peptidase family M28